MTVHFVGAGPGAADLLTQRAVDLLGRADVVLYPGTYLDAAVLGHCRPGARLVDTQRLDLDRIVAALVDAHRAGRTVVRLTSGDPSLYSALYEQTRRLDALAVPWDVAPGVPAYAAAAARLGAELTVPEVAQSVVLTRARARSTAMPRRTRSCSISSMWNSSSTNRQCQSRPSIMRLRLSSVPSPSRTTQSLASSRW